MEHCPEHVLADSAEHSLDMVGLLQAYARHDHAAVRAILAKIDDLPELALFMLDYIYSAIILNATADQPRIGWPQRMEIGKEYVDQFAEQLRAHALAKLAEDNA
jgi:hypothetical protein